MLPAAELRGIWVRNYGLLPVTKGSALVLNCDAEKASKILWINEGFLKSQST